MLREPIPFQVADALNAQCHCLSVPLPPLREAVEARLRSMGVSADIAASHPHLFSQTSVFVSAQDARRMDETARAVETVVGLPAYRESVLAWAPEIARYDSGARGAFLGFDFHLSPDGPKLIEINTNAGGGFLAATLGEAALACCGGEVRREQGPRTFDERVIRMLVAEWRGAGRAGTPRSAAIVDESPADQYLYPEFLLAQGALRRAGIDAVVASPEQLEHVGGTLRAAGMPVDIVYNRLTDFALEANANRALRDAYLNGSAVVTPNPRAHALYADKRALSLLGDAQWLQRAGAPADAAALLSRAIPSTRLVEARDADAWWRDRKGHFFKPVAGYGSRGAYRGDKLTRRVFEEILAGGYVAQALVPPPERTPAAGAPPLRFDVRNFAYAGEVQLRVARLWRGQTTNFRSEGGGFAPVLVLP